MQLSDLEQLNRIWGSLSEESRELYSELKEGEAAIHSSNRTLMEIGKYLFAIQRFTSPSDIQLRHQASMMGTQIRLLQARQSRINSDPTASVSSVG